MPENFYDLLDVAPDASEEEIKRAFREQVHVYHPDRNDDDRARAQFTVLKKAYDVLTDPEERQTYDRLGHEKYVAKRTKGLPSPDRWKTSVDSGSDADANSNATADRRRGPGDDSTDSRRSERGETRADDGRTANATSSTNGGTNARNDGAGDATGSQRRTRSRGQSRSRTVPFGDHRLVRWWRRRNFASPLLRIATLTYLLGLAHFAARNATALRSLASDLAAVGVDPVGAWEVLASDRHGLDSAYEHVTDVEIVSPPLEPFLWHATLVAVLVLTLAGLVTARIAWRDHTWGPVTIDETIVAGSALGATSMLISGPLLAGAVLLPPLFGVVVRRTRVLPGWSPSYVYVAAVSAPAVALAAGAIGHASRPFEVIAVWVLPLVGALGLPLRAWVRERYGI